MPEAMTIDLAEASKQRTATARIAAKYLAQKEVRDVLRAAGQLLEFAGDHATGTLRNLAELGDRYAEIEDQLGGGRS